MENFYSESEGEESKKQLFHRVVPLHEKNEYSWAFLNKEIPLLPRGWFELSRLPKEDRIEFIRDFWLVKLSSTASNAGEIYLAIREFFDDLEDIGIFATQQEKESPFEVHMTYSFKGDRFFFHGSPPASKESIANLQKQFPKIHFPNDYLAFLEIHDGFCKYTDTGLIKIRDMAKTYLKFQSRINLEELLFLSEDQMIEPKRLVPFYESSGLHCYQCFYTEWAPEGEMGNVYYSEDEILISDFLDRDNLVENLAFTSFLYWLTFYLQDLTA